MNNEEVIQTIKSGHIAEGLIAYAMYKGATPDIMKTRLWESKIDDTWLVKCNGRDHDIDGIPAFSWFIEFNGWPAGIMSIMGDGVLCAGAAGNEDALRTALLNAVK